MAAVSLRRDRDAHVRTWVNAMLMLYHQVLLKNRAKVLYCTRLKGAQSDEDKQAIQVS